MDPKMSISNEEDVRSPYFQILSFLRPGAGFIYVDWPRFVRISAFANTQTFEGLGIGAEAAGRHF